MVVMNKRSEFETVRSGLQIAMYSFIVATGQIRTSAGHSPTVIDFIGPLCWALRGFRRMNDVPEDVDPDGHYLGELFPA